MKSNPLWQLGRVFAVWACIALGLLSLSSCKEDMASPGIVGYNHTKDRSIYYFTVNDQMGSNIGPESGGGKLSCCASIPRKWHPGIKVKIAWVYQGGTELPPPPPPQQAEIEVPEYGDSISTLDVHFFPNHVVKVFVSDMTIDHPDYPAELKWIAQPEASK